MTIHHITELTEFQTLIAQNTKVVVDFTATWCGPCKMISPEFDKLSQDTNYSQWTFCKVDVDDGDEIANECNITAMPTFHYYVNGKLADQFSGADVNTLVTKIKAL
jgi:thioredoxin 1